MRQRQEEEPKGGPNGKATEDGLAISAPVAFCRKDDTLPPWRGVQGLKVAYSNGGGVTPREPGSLTEQCRAIVLSSEGRSVGQLEHMGYRLHTDHPDEIVVSRLQLVWKRRRVLPFNAVEAVDARAGTVTLRRGWDSVERAPSV